MAQAILLTGATGLLGRFLLRDLLASGRSVGVLVRAGAGRTACERLDELRAFADESLGRSLPRPILLEGELGAPRLGLGAAGRNWLARARPAVVHSAAHVSYRQTADGEPWETNVHGTRRLLELCQTLGLSELHHVSTAFVCGERRGTVREDELDCGRGSKNVYEQSKVAAEQLVRQFRGVRATVYRPAVIVGDSRTGYTSTYHHFYRFLELAVRLSRTQGLRLRLPLTGDETQNLVPVDWVSQALVRLLGRPRWHGYTFHLAAGQAPRLRAIQAILEEWLPLGGIEWVGPDGLSDPTSLEERVLEEFRDYWSYVRGDLTFDCRNTRAALPDLPPPAFDRTLVNRLFRFAEKDHWGRGRDRPPAPGAFAIRAYLEQDLPQRLERSAVGQAVPSGVGFDLDVRGPGGGQWSCRRAADGWDVRPGLTGAAVCYRTDPATFVRVVERRQALQEAFFAGRIDIEGDWEQALKLAAVIERFLAEGPAAGGQREEVARVAGER
jgi:thioester reductase-like protein